VNNRWEIAVSFSDGSFEQVSFVNGICTNRGGTHVTHAAEAVVDSILKEANKKKNKTAPVKPQHIKNHLWVFVNSLIENPAFDSQTKETLTTKPSAFGSKCEVSEKFIKQVLKSGVVERVVNWAKLKQDSLLKKNNGKKTSRLFNIPKLDDANWAGTAKSKLCTLILTEVR
jgi:DNA topoisomerase-2